MIEIIFVAFAIVALILFRFVTPARAVPITCFAGWLILPVGNFPAGSADAIFPYWITGTALPSNMLLTKMWWPPVVALAGALWMDRETIASWRPGWLDVPMALWCLWPIGQWPFVATPEPQPLIASFYLAASWGAPWLLGRIYFGGYDGGKQLIIAITAGLAVIAPIALVESALGPRFYGWFYGPHPFRFDGQKRYIGFRPLAFFEHGNQYGIWLAVIALAAFWLWRSAPKPRIRRWFAALAVISLTIALMSQSVGAVLLLFAGLAILFTTGRPLTRWILPLILLVMTLGVATYLSGKVPLRAIAENTAIGRGIVNLARSSGRGSFTWRIARDQNAMPLIRAHPVLGTAQWDWWRRNDERPWDLPLLIMGQFGLIGFVLAFGCLITPVLYAVAHQWRADVWRLDVGTPLSIIVVMAIADSLSNSFFFYPAILAAGALGPTGRRSAHTPAVSDQKA